MVRSRLTSVLFFLAAVLPSSSQSSIPARKVQGDRFPVVLVGSPQPDHVPASTRRLRGARFDINKPGVNPAKFRLTKSSQPLVLQLGSAHRAAYNLQPANESDVILIGTVQTACAFLSNDSTQVYSEFAVSVEETIKGGVGIGPIDVQQYGGRVRFPDGTVLLRGEQGRDLPIAGGRYVFFLRRNPDGEDYTVLTSYELADGRAVSLDRGVAKKKVSQKTYEQTSEQELLMKIRAMLGRTEGGAK